MERHHIVTVEDDPVSRSLLASYFKKAGYRVTEVADGIALRTIFAREKVDLVLLDINLPGDDGLTLVREIRAKSDIGIILVTVRSNDLDRILGLELGADDYVTKPFNERELLARVKNLLRRTLRKPEAASEEERILFHGWTLDRVSRGLHAADGSEVPLTNVEFRLLDAFLQRPGRAFTRDDLLDAISGRDWAPNDRTIDVLVSRLRRKLEEDPKRPRILVTVHGVGYQLAVMAKAPPS